MPAATKYALAPAASTGNNTHTAVVPSDHTNAQIGVQFVVEAAGATPTITWKVQGSLDGTNWYDVFYVTDASDTAAATARTATAAGGQVEWLDAAGGSRMYTQYRLVTSANTNITYRGELYVLVGNSW